MAKGLSKDDVYFGVRSIDKSCFRRPPAVPMPATNRPRRPGEHGA